MGACPPGHPAYVDVVLESVQGLSQALHGHQHVLHHVVLLVQLAQSLALGQLQEGDLGGHHPAKEIAEDGVVAKRDDILKDREGGWEDGTTARSSIHPGQVLQGASPSLKGRVGLYQTELGLIPISHIYQL